MNNIYNKQSIFLIIIFMVLLVTECEKRDNGPINDGAKIINIDGVNREYIMYIPSSYDSIDTVPLMLNFHGWTMYANEQMEISDMRLLAESEKFILIYPQGTFFNGSTHWNVGSWTSGSNSDDLGFIDELITHISNNYNIDMKRIYAAGYSNGGFFSLELACKLSNNIAAIGTVAANMSTRTRDNCNPSHPMPLVTISGTNDNEVSYYGTNFQGQMSHIEVLNYWISYNQINDSPIITELPNTDTSDGSSVKLYQYKNGNNDVEIEHYKVINGGHDWPGSFGNMDINADSVIWNFVSKFDINGKI